MNRSIQCVAFSFCGTLVLLISNRWRARRSTLLARTGLTAVLAMLVGSLSMSAAYAKDGNQTTTMALTVAAAAKNDDLLRVNFGNDNLNTRGLVKAEMTVKRTIKGKEEKYTVNGAVSPADNSRVQFSTAGLKFSDKNQLFAPNDKVEFTITLKGKAKVAVSSAGIFATGNIGVDQSIKTAGFKFNIDPDYTIYNDLDIPSPATDSQMQVENLQFMSNLTQSQFDALDPESLFGQPVTSSFTLSSSQALSPSFPTSALFPNSITEPDYGNYDVAEGLVFNPDTGETTAFLHAIQANTPEPGALAMLLGMGVSASVFVFKRRRK
jgi:hypothetical protein